MRIEHTLPPDLLSRRAIRVLVIGAGGTGSAIVMGSRISTRQCEYGAIGMASKSP